MTNDRQSVNLGKSADAEILPLWGGVHLVV
jgi:hypothetical protein